VPGLLEGNPAQVWIQVKSVLITIVYCAVLSFVILKLVDLVIGLRVEREVEREGLDLALHGEAVH
jgi:Amt family ammonium transporter